jgi:predicted DNA-binding protein
VQTAFRIPESLLERLHAEADAREVSANYLVVKAIESHLRELADRADVPARGRDD